MGRIPWQAAHQFGVFTTEQALAMGWTSRGLAWAASSGRLIRLRRGTFTAAATELVGPELDRYRIGQQGVAAALRIPAATVSHVSAIGLHGLPLLEPVTWPCITLEPPLRTRPSALHVHRQPIPVGQLDPGSDIKLTNVARSCIDLTRECGLAAGVVAADAALHLGLCTPAELAAVYAESCRGRAGLTEGRRLLESLDANAESVLESVSRLAMAGLPPPGTQVVIRTMHGRFLARVDFYWPEFGLVGEADGRLKYTDDELWREKERQDALAEHGLVTVRWGWSIARRPAALRARLQEGMRRAGLLRAAGIPVTAIVRPESTLQRAC